LKTLARIPGRHPNSRGRIAKNPRKAIKTAGPKLKAQSSRVSGYRSRDRPGGPGARPRRSTPRVGKEDRGGCQRSLNSTGGCSSMVSTRNGQASQRKKPRNHSTPRFITPFTPVSRRLIAPFTLPVSTRRPDIASVQPRSFVENGAAGCGLLLNEPTTEGAQGIAGHGRLFRQKGGAGARSAKEESDEGRPAEARSGLDVRMFALRR